MTQECAKRGDRLRRAGALHAVRDVIRGAADLAFSRVQAACQAREGQQKSA